jgi:hypothetical protein
MRMAVPVHRDLSRGLGHVSDCELHLVGRPFATNPPDLDIEPTAALEPSAEEDEDGGRKGGTEKARNWLCV